MLGSSFYCQKPSTQNLVIKKAQNLVVSSVLGLSGRSAGQGFFEKQPGKDYTL